MIILKVNHPKSEQPTLFSKADSSAPEGFYNQERNPNPVLQSSMRYYLTTSLNHA